MFSFIHSLSFSSLKIIESIFKKITNRYKSTVSVSKFIVLLLLINILENIQSSVEFLAFNSKTNLYILHHIALVTFDTLKPRKDKGQCPLRLFSNSFFFFFFKTIHCCPIRSSVNVSFFHP